MSRAAHLFHINDVVDELRDSHVAPQQNRARKIKSQALIPRVIAQVSTCTVNPSQYQHLLAWSYLDSNQRIERIESTSRATATYHLGQVTIEHRISLQHQARDRCQVRSKDAIIQPLVLVSMTFVALLQWNVTQECQCDGAPRNRHTSLNSKIHHASQSVDLTASPHARHAGAVAMPQA